MSDFSSLSTVGKLLKINFWFYLIFSIFLGYFISHLKIKNPNYIDKNYCLIVLLIIYTIYNTIAEIIFLNTLQKDTDIYISIFKNPLIKIFIIKILIIFFGGTLIFFRFNLYSNSSYLIFSVLVAFFVGSIFESFRHLVRSR